VIGAGPGGLTAAYYLAKKGHGVTVFDALPAAGGMARYGIPSYRVPLAVIDQEVGEVEKLGVEFRFNTRIENVDELKAQGFDAVFLGIGAQSGDPLGIPGDTLPNVIDSPTFLRAVTLGKVGDGETAIVIGKRVAVIGGGNSGVEAAIDLAGIVSHVTLLEFDSKLRADAVLQAKLGSLPNVTIITSALTTEVTGDGEKVNGIAYTDRNSGQVKRVELEGIFVQIGLLPNTDWLKGTIGLSARGEIEIDARGQTSLPGVFAAGDATTTPYKQIIIAMGDGAKASLSAFDHLIRSPAVKAATPTLDLGQPA
jgi:alkyl hydroperoxide reductase subunit F